MKGKIPIGPIIFGAVAIFIVALFIYNVNQTPEVQNAHLGDGEVWHEYMVLGDIEAPNRLIDYTDYFCSYCGDLSRAAGEEFERDYIDTGKVAFENRVVTILSGRSPNAEQGAEAAHCAADQDKYWQYSRHIMPRIKQDYFDKGIGTNTAPVYRPIEKLPIDYFLTSARAVDMDEAEFKSCMESEKHRDQIATDTRRAISLGVNGLPFIVANNFTTSGFQGGYDGLKTVLQAGGVE